MCVRRKKMEIDATALCSLEDVSFYMDIKTEDGEVADVDFITGTINNISTAMEIYCGLEHFTATLYTEYHDGGGYGLLFPDRYPITTVSGIYDDDSWTWDVDTLIDPTTYRVIDRNRIVLKDGGFFGNYVQNVKLIYTAGFATIPGDLKLACIKEVARLFRTRIDKGVESRSVQVNNIFTKYVMDEFMPETRTVLNRYRVKSAK